MADTNNKHNREENEKEVKEQQPPTKKFKEDENGDHEASKEKEEEKECMEKHYNCIQHIDLPCKDLDRIGKFYADAFGWKIEKTDFPFYRLWSPPVGTKVKPLPRPSSSAFSAVSFPAKTFPANFFP